MSQKAERISGISITLNADTFTRKDRISGIVSFARGSAIPKRLTVRWTDGFGRTVNEIVRCPGANDNPLPFTFPAAPALCIGNRIELAGPDGAVIPLYSRNILGAGGKASGVLHLALSDPPGRYTLTAHDIATGKTGSRAVRVD